MPRPRWSSTMPSWPFSDRLDCRHRPALNNRLIIDQRFYGDDPSEQQEGYWAFALYSLLAIAALWFPVVIAVLTTLSSDLLADAWRAHETRLR